MKTLVKRFDFVSDDRSLFVFDGTTITNQHRLQISPISPPGELPVLYDTSEEFFVETRITNPNSIIQWTGFDVEHDPYPAHPDPHSPDPAFVMRFRLSDGTTQNYWNGSSWVEAVDADSHWNTQFEVAQNIENFPVSTKSIGVVVGIRTNHNLITPSLRALKLSYSSNVDEFWDLFFGSLIPTLTENVLGYSRVAYEFTSDSSTLDLSNLTTLGFDSTYRIVSVSEAYNHTTDPNKTVNIFDSFVDGTLTLTESISAGEVLWIEFSYTITVVLNTSRDYFEVPRFPIVVIDDVVERISVAKSGYHDTILGEFVGLTIPGPKVVDFRFTIEALSDKQYDEFRLSSSILEFISNNSILRLRGTDEWVEMMIENGRSEITHANHKNERKTRFTVSITNVPIQELQPIVANRIQTANFGGNLPLSQ